ncbi:MAG: YolD-like family protein [Bacilli bacterium]|nr:YolD-like family protein [Bacilli bacterium]
MHKLDRGMIKWQPFDSVVSGKQVVRDVLKKKNEIKMPALSEEQRNSIEEKLILSFYENEKITLDYYYQGKLLKLCDNIKKIDSTYRKIYFSNKTLLFDQIVKIY